MRLGRATVPAFISAASFIVWATWLSRTWRGAILELEPTSGTLPWMRAIVLVASSRSGGGWSGSASSAPASGTAAREAMLSVSRRQPSPAHGDCQQTAAEGDDEAHQRRSADCGEPTDRRRRLAKGQSAPGKSTEWRAITEKLLKNPACGDPQRCERMPLDRGQCRA